MGHTLVSEGHEVIYLEDALAKGSSDQLVATSAQENEAVLIAFDGDMKKLAQGYGVSKSRYKTLSIIKMNCDEPSAAIRIHKELYLIESEWERNNHSGKRRLFVEIFQTAVKIWR